MTAERQTGAPKTASTAEAKRAKVREAPGVVGDAPLSAPRPGEGGPRLGTQGGWFTGWVLPLLVLALGVGAFVVINRHKPNEKRGERAKSALMVAAMPVEPKTARANVVSRGVVQAERELTIIPEVSGKLVFVSKALEAGGRVKRGQLLLRIDARSYAHQVTQTRGQLESARLQVEVEKNQKNLVEYESKLLGETSTRSPVASRESYVRAAEANVQAQEGAVESAKLNLSRTAIAAPFDATVVSENVEQGQVVSAQSQLARLIATDELRVQVSVPVEDLEMFGFPSKDAPGASARVRQDLPRGKVIERLGEVTRLVRELDQATRRARVLVTIKHPFDPALGLPLLPGAHVEVEIRGRELENVVVIDRSAVYEGKFVWVVGEDDKLDKKELEIVWSDRDHVYVNPKFGPADRVVTTLMSTPVKGLPVRVQGESEKPVERTKRASEPAPGG